MVEFRICVFSARRAVGHALYGIANHGSDILSNIESYVDLFPKTVHHRKNLLDTLHQARWCRGLD